MLGAYLALFRQLGIDANMPIEPQAGFTHPVEHENQKMTREFMNTMNVLNAAKASKGLLALSDARVQGTQVTFMFCYDE